MRRGRKRGPEERPRRGGSGFSLGDGTHPLSIFVHSVVRGLPPPPPPPPPPSSSKTAHGLHFGPSETRTAVVPACWKLSGLLIFGEEGLGIGSSPLLLPLLLLLLLFLHLLLVLLNLPRLRLKYILVIIITLVTAIGDWLFFPFFLFSLFPFFPFSLFPFFPFFSFFFFTFARMQCGDFLYHHIC